MNKYHAQKVTFYGETFDSRKEGERWLLLRSLQKRGKIKGLRRQVKYELTPAFPKADLRAMHYYADFVYEQDGETAVEDVKGYRKGAAYELFKAKKKMLYWRYGLLIREV